MDQELNMACARLAEEKTARRACNTQMRERDVHSALEIIICVNLSVATNGGQ